MAVSLGVEEADIPTRVDTEGAKSLAVVSPAQEIVASVLLALGKVERKDEVGDFHPVDLIGFCLYGVAHLKPVKHRVTEICRMRPLHEEVRLSIAHQFQCLMRQRDGPVLAQLL